VPDEQSQSPSRHPQLNLLNLEAVAVAVARLRSAVVWLSVQSTNDILPSVLQTEHVAWSVRSIG
jgi:hypothetical protein